MLWLLLLLSPAFAADEPTPEGHLFCQDPVAAVCDHAEPLKVDYTKIEKRFRKALASNDPQAEREVYAVFKDIEKQSFIPLFEESQARLLDALQATSGISAQERVSLKKALEPVKFVSLSSAPEATERMRKIWQKLPKTSILRQSTPEAFEVVGKLRFDRMTPAERELMRLILLYKVLKRAQQTDCGESVPFNAFSLGNGWGIPSVAVCMKTTIDLQPLDVQARYPILGMIFAHELGHHIDTGPFPALYGKYLSCLNAERPGPLASKKFTDDQSRELVADFWSALAVGNMIKTRAALLEESPEDERNRAFRFIRGSLQWLCGAKQGPNDTHQPGTFRLGKIFGDSPEIRKILGCKPKPSCGLEGLR